VCEEWGREKSKKEAHVEQWKRDVEVPEKSKWSYKAAFLGLRVNSEKGYV